MADSVYKGGIPSQGFTGTFPNSSSDGGGFKPSDGPAAMTASHGGPATFSGSSAEGFLDDSGYHAPGELRQGGMSVKDLDDVKNSV